MRIIHNIKNMVAYSKNVHREGKTIGFVPTMGALHEGHLSIIRQARKENDVVVVSIFVNPIQFGPREDLKKYPKDIERDARLCKSEGADIIFYPNAKDIYPDNFRTFITVDGLSDYLCGRFRPGHFKGVTTVVAKLFNIVCPDIAYFGQKDAQQAIIIKRMAGDLNMPLQIKVMPTVREQDGLAMSSRNAYLNKKERLDAAVLYQALSLAKNLIGRGNRGSLAIVKQMRQLINKIKSAKIEYVSIVGLNDLKPVNKIKNKVLIALSVRIGRTRLIDNIIVNC